MLNISKGRLEAEISEAIIKFEKEHMGRGPKEARTFIIQDMILVRLKGVLTPAEQQLSKDPKGSGLIKQVRLCLIENSRGLLENIIHDLTGTKFTSLHTDISTKTGERVIAFSLPENLEDKLKSFNKIP